LCLEQALEQALPDLIGLRRHLLPTPELNGAEYQTAALVAGSWRQLGWTVREGVGGTGVGWPSLGPVGMPLGGLAREYGCPAGEERTGLAFALLPAGS